MIDVNSEKYKMAQDLQDALRDYRLAEEKLKDIGIEIETFTPVWEHLKGLFKYVLPNSYDAFYDYLEDVAVEDLFWVERKADKIQSIEFGIDIRIVMDNGETVTLPIIID